MEMWIDPFQLSSDELKRKTQLSDIVRVVENKGEGERRGIFLAFPSASFERMRLQKPPEEKPHIIKEAFISSSATTKPRASRGRPKGKVDDSNMKTLTLPTGHEEEEEEEVVCQTVVGGRRKIEIFDCNVANTEQIYNDLQEIFDAVNAEAFRSTDVEAKKPFFMRISKSNCESFHLKDYAVQPCCLPIIRERLDRGHYRDALSMYADIESIFTNINTFYPSGHPAAIRATELKLFLEDLKISRRLLGVL